MDKYEIIREAKTLPVNSRRDIINALEKSVQMEDDAATAEERFKELVPLACAALDVAEYNPRTKRNGDAYVRNLCAYVMRREGYSLSRIGKAMGRDTSSVISMSRRGDEMRSGYFGREYKERFAKFENSIKQND
jgi:hypothetical protein